MSKGSLVGGKQVQACQPGGTLRWGFFLSDEKETKESPKGPAPLDTPGGGDYHRVRLSRRPWLRWGHMDGAEILWLLPAPLFDWYLYRQGLTLAQEQPCTGGVASRIYLGVRRTIPPSRRCGLCIPRLAPERRGKSRSRRRTSSPHQIRLGFGGDPNVAPCHLPLHKGGFWPGAFFNMVL